EFLSRGELDGGSWPGHRDALGALAGHRLLVPHPEGLRTARPAHQGAGAAQDAVDAADAAGDAPRRRQYVVEQPDAEPAAVVGRADDVEHGAGERVGVTARTS